MSEKEDLGLELAEAELQSLGEARGATVDQLVTILEAADYVSQWLDSDNEAKASFMKWYAKNIMTP